jgi:hypothetical protein
VREKCAQTKNQEQEAISMNPRPITKEEAAIRVRAEPEHIPVEGNALVSGDDALDREAEQEILQRLDQGDTWAWAAVTVTATWGPFAASDHLGCCSYADEADFTQPGGYYDDMVDAALDELNQTILDAYRRIKERERAA